MNPNRSAWDGAVDGYAPFAEDCTSLFAEDLLRLVPAAPGSRALDLAAGTGAVALAAARAGAAVEAVDSSVAMARHLIGAAAASGVVGVRVSVQDGHRLGFGGGAFNTVWSLFGLVLFEDPLRGLAECHRVLAPGGRVGIGAWSPRQDSGRVLVDALRRALPDRPLPVERQAFWQYGNRESLGAALADAGFTSVGVVTVRRPWIVRSADEFWAALPTYSPTAAAGLADLNDEQRAALGRQVVHDLWLRFGDGRVVLETEALLAFGTR